MHEEIQRVNFRQCLADIFWQVLSLHEHCIIPTRVLRWVRLNDLLKVVSPWALWPLKQIPWCPSAFVPGLNPILNKLSISSFSVCAYCQPRKMCWVSNCLWHYTHLCEISSLTPCLTSLICTFYIGRLIKWYIYNLWSRKNSMDIDGFIDIF